MGLIGNDVGMLSILDDVKFCMLYGSKKKYLFLLMVEIYKCFYLLLLFVFLFFLILLIGSDVLFFCVCGLFVKEKGMY